MEIQKPLCVVVVLTYILSSGNGQIFTDCGGAREGPSGAIVSPNYPSSYPNNARCNWTITAQPNEIIDLSVTLLDLDGYVDACPDTVTIFDGDSGRSTPIIQLCRYKNDTELKKLQIRSTGNKMFVTFISDAAYPRAGFLMTYTTQVCPPMMYGAKKCDTNCACNPTNTAYCNNFNGTCYCKPGWASARCDVDVNECADPQVEKCPFDYKMCVNNPGSFSCECRPGLVKNGNSCEVKPGASCTLGCSHLCGVTDDMRQYCYCPYNMMLNGAKCEACKPLTYGKDCERRCACNATNTERCDSVTGQCICKPGWTNETCSVDVDECRLAQYVDTCDRSKYLQCINTPGSYRCGCPDGFAILTANGSCVQACDNNITKSPSVIQSGNYPAPYWDNAQCSWLIRASSNSTISVNVSNLHTEASWDFVYFYDGTNTSSRLLAKFSGIKYFNEPIRSTNSSMFIRFTSDYAIAFSGFNAVYTESAYPQGCSNVISAQNLSHTWIGTDLTRGNPTMLSRIFCYWSINAPTGSMISLNFESVSTDPACKSFIAVYNDTYASDGTLYGKYCGTNNNGIIRLPKVFIIYQSEEDTPRTGFKARVNYCSPFHYGPDLCTTPCVCLQNNSYWCDSLDGSCLCKPGWTSETCANDVNECAANPCSKTEKCINTIGSYKCEPDCDKYLSRSFGEVTTVLYPDYPLARAQCKWVITGAANEVVTLIIDNGKFNLFETTSCSYDSLDIYNGEVNTTNQIGKYCGSRIPGIIRSTSNKMTLQLKTLDGSRNGFSGIYNTHECRNFTYGKKCENMCGCSRNNTQFCDNINGVCVCKVGWTGINCDEDINECRTNVCQENNTCENTPGSFSCSCLPGFKKNSLGKCEGNSENCVLASKKYCSHYCIKENNIVTCVCPEGMEIGGLYREQCVAKLYPYGTAVGDLTKSAFLNTIPNKKYGEVKFSSEVPFGDTIVNTAYIHNSGVISFVSPAISETPNPNETQLLIEAFWANISVASVEVYYHLYEKCESSVFLESRGSSSPAKQKVMERAARDVIKMTSYSDFDVNSVLVVTWKNFTALSKTPLNGKQITPQQNIFQAVFISGNRKGSISDQDFSDEETSYVFYIYPKDKMQWCNNRLIGVSAGMFSRLDQGISQNCLKDFPEIISYQVGQKTSTVQQCQRYVCKNSRQITNPVYRQEIEQLYKCPCTLDRLGLQWTIYEQRSPNIYCFAISQVAKRRLLASNPRNKLCCYRWNKPTDNSNWQIWAQQLSLATFIHNSSDAGHVVPGDPGLYEGVRESINAHQWCCKDSKSRLCDRFNKIYPDMECSYNVEFVSGFLLGDPTIVTLDNFTYLMNGWGEYTLMDVPSENFTLQARTDRIETSKGPSNGTVFTAFAAKDGYGTQFQVELSDSKTSLQVLIKGLNVTESFYQQVDYRFSTDDIDVVRDNSGNKTKVVVSFPCGVSFMVQVGQQNLELEMQVLKRLQNKTKGLLGNFNGKTNDEFTLPNGTVLPANSSESQIFYKFASQYLVQASKSVFIYKTGKRAADYQHASFIPTFMDAQNATLLAAATALCGAGRAACIYDYLITNDAQFAKNSDNTVKQSAAKTILLANNCPNVSIAKNENYTEGRWFVQEGMVNKLRINAADADKDVLTYMLYESVTGVSINQSGFLLYTPSTASPVNIGFRVKDSNNCYTPVFNIRTAICPQCRNNGRCFRNDTRDIEYFGGQVQIQNCKCPPSFTGDNCETELDACLSKPCAKGKTCTDLTAAQQGNSLIGYICGPCPKGFVDVEGVCLDINECERPNTCHHTCENTEGSFVCGCNTGYVLNRTDSRTCLAKNCSNRCIMSNTWYCDESVSACVCKNNIQTTDCSVVVNLCASNPCPANRRCSSKTNGYECRCMNGLLPVNGVCLDCNRKLSDPSGSFMSSNYPDNYPNSDVCTWTITSNDTNSVILLNITDYQVEGCPYDYLEIYDGSSINSDIIGQFCGDIPDLISSSGNSMFIAFSSDESVSKKGFFATYVVESMCRVKKCSHGCKLLSASPRVEQCLCPEWTRLDSTQTTCIEINACNTTVSTNTGTLVSPGYPQPYRANASCHWIIPSKPQTVATISFSDMDIEGGVSCPYDSLKIYNGKSSSFPLLGVYCGSSLPRSISTTSGLYLVFTSDASIGGRGFKLGYTYDSRLTQPINN